MGGNIACVAMDAKRGVTKRLDRESLRLATKDKRPLKRGWNQSWFKERLSKDELLERHQE